MNFDDFLSPRAVCLDACISSQKKLLEKIAQLLTSNNAALSAQDVVDCLSAREKLGSTALGNAVAIPHCRIQSIEQPITAVLRIKPPIDYGAPDNRKVALFFALLVPQQAPAAHLQILATLASQLQDQAWTEQLLNAANTDVLLARLKNNSLSQNPAGTC